MKKRKRWMSIFLALCLTIVTILPVQAGGVVEEEVDQAQEASAPADASALEIPARSYILLESNTGTVITEKDADVQMPPASITKIMTLLLVMEAVDSGKTVSYTHLGMVNLSGLVLCTVENVFEKSTASRIIQLVQESAAQKGTTERFISKFAKVYTPIIILCAIAVAFLPPLILQQPLEKMCIRDRLRSRTDGIRFNGTIKIIEKCNLECPEQGKHNENKHRKIA